MIAFGSIYGDIFPATLDGGYSVEVGSRPLYSVVTTKTGSTVSICDASFPIWGNQTMFKTATDGPQKSHSSIPFQWLASYSRRLVCSISFVISNSGNLNRPGCKILVVVQNIDALKLINCSRSPYCLGVCILWSVHNVSYPETRFISGGCQEATSFLPLDPSPFTPKYIPKQYCPFYPLRNISSNNIVPQNISSSNIVPI